MAAHGKGHRQVTLIRHPDAGKQFHGMTDRRPHSFICIHWDTAGFDCGQESVTPGRVYPHHVVMPSSKYVGGSLDIVNHMRYFFCRKQGCAQILQGPVIPDVETS